MGEEIELKAISELKEFTFIIPYMQRGYRWTSKNIETLLSDLEKFIEKKEKLYCLQPLTVVDKGCKKYELIDGQQRLTTLFLIYKYLNNASWYNFEYEKDLRNERFNFLKNKIEKIDDSKIDFYYISNAYFTIEKWFNNDENKEKKIRDLLNATKEENSIQILWYRVSEDKAATAFRDINSGKIQLTNSDLIKALLLNRKADITNQDMIAAQFDSMEKTLEENRFWYMFNSKDVNKLKGQSRIDLLFNISFEKSINNSDYENDPRLAFFKISNYSSSELVNYWKLVRNKFQILKDFYDNPYFYHYIGCLFLFNKLDRKRNELDTLIKKYQNTKKTEFVEYLKKQITESLSHSSLEEYSYNDEKKELIKIFVLHNVQTILQNYEILSKSNGLKYNYEYFPFELFYTQNWNIEHIDSHTANDYKEEDAKKEFINNIEDDYGYLFKNENDFTQDYLGKREKLEQDLKNQKIFEEYFDYCESKITNNPIKDKNDIGNLVLLDEHTNKFFHNSLFPKKRRIVIMAGGLRNKNDIEKNVRSVYVPVCTKQIYVKAYTKTRKLNINTWNQDDFDAYVKDMHEKLDGDFFIFKQESK